ncbi:MAG: hypothetical protein ABI557_17070 [Aureliella sp.]
MLALFDLSSIAGGQDSDLFGDPKFESQDMEVTIAVVALCIAFWQLKLQRDEIRLNSRLNALIHIAGLMREKIEHHETIIENLKSRRSDWSGHAMRVNGELRPLLARINQELIDSVAHRAAGLDMQAIRDSLKLGSTAPAKPENGSSGPSATNPAATSIRRVA